jgi:hypothetical protein
VLRAGALVTAATTIVAGLVGSSLASHGLADPVGVAIFTAVAALVGVISTVAWLVGQAFPRAGATRPAHSHQYRVERPTSARTAHPDIDSGGRPDGSCTDGLGSGWCPARRSKRRIGCIALESPILLLSVGAVIIGTGINRWSRRR